MVWAFYSWLPVPARAFTKGCHFANFGNKGGQSDKSDEQRFTVKPLKQSNAFFLVSNDSKGNQQLESESERGSWNVEQNAGFTCDRLGNRPEQPNLPNLLPSVSIQIGIHCRKSSGKIETRTKLSCWEIFYTKYFGHVLKCSVRFKKHFRGYGAYCRITNCMSWFPNKPT